MWICSACQNENKDEYRFCLCCGQSRPSAEAKPAPPKAPVPSDRKKPLTADQRTGRTTLLLLILLALLLIGTIAAVILFFPRVLDTDTGGASEGTEEERISRPRREKEEGGESGWSSILSGETAQPVPTAAAETPAPTAVPIPTAVPTQTPQPTPTPTPTPAVTPDLNADYLLPDSNSRYLTEDDLKGFTHEQCVLARNEIFARHGYIFNTDWIAAHFMAKSWYKGTVPGRDFSYSVFNRYEVSNIDFIRSYETRHWGG